MKCTLRKILAITIAAILTIIASSCQINSAESAASQHVDESYVSESYFERNVSSSKISPDKSSSFDSSKPVFQQYFGLPYTQKLPKYLLRTTDEIGAIIKKIFVSDENLLNISTDIVDISCEEAALDYLAQLLGITEIEDFTKIKADSSFRFIIYYYNQGEEKFDDSFKKTYDNGTVYRKYTDLNIYEGVVCLTLCEDGELTAAEDGSVCYLIECYFSHRVELGVCTNSDGGKYASIGESSGVIDYGVYPDGKVRVLSNLYSDEPEPLNIKDSYMD